VLGALTKQGAYNVSLLRAFATASWAELDYEHEASNQERFRAYFDCVDKPRADAPPAAGGGRGWLRGGGRRAAAAAERERLSTVYIPRVYSAHSSRRVLTTEWVQGEYLARSSPAVIGTLVPVGVACFLRQLLEFGLFHADPHPGNLLVTPDGRLALIDFGLCAEVPAPDTARLSAAIVHAMAADTRLLVDDAIALGFLPDDVDRAALAPLLRAVLRSGTDAMLAAADGEPEPADAPRRAYGAVARRRRHFAQISDELNSIFFSFPFLVPDYFALITRALVVLEGIALTGDSDFDILGSAFPWVARHAARELRAGSADGAGHVFAATRLALGAVASPERAAAELAAKLAA
jgi:aarF domain-containing kinase